MHRTLTEAFICDNEEITDQNTVANKFSEYFVNVSPNLASKIPLTMFFKSLLHHESFFIDPLTEKEVEKNYLS